MFDWSQLFWPSIVAGGVLLLFVLLTVVGKRRGSGTGKPLTLRVIVGMFLGRPEAWAEFRELYNQPPPPPEADKLTAIRQILAGEKPPKSTG